MHIVFILTTEKGVCFINIFVIFISAVGVPIVIGITNKYRNVVN